MAQVQKLFGLCDFYGLKIEMLSTSKGGSSNEHW